MRAPNCVSEDVSKLGQTAAENLLACIGVPEKVKS